MQPGSKPWRTVAIILGVLLVAAGVGLNESGVEVGRLLFIAGIVVIALVVIAAVLPRNQPQPVTPPSDGGEHTLKAIADRWGMDLQGTHASGIVKGRSVVVTASKDAFRLQARAARALDMGLTVMRGGKPPGDARKEYTTGDSDFDTHYCVRVDERSRAEKLLTKQLRKHLLTAHASLDDRGAELWVPLCGADELMAAVRLGCKVAGELDRASPKVRSAEGLEQTRETWLDYAQKHKLATSDTPLSMWGTVGGLTVQAIAVRDGFKQFHFEVKADFPEALGRGLMLKPASSATQFDRSSAPIGHPAFDKVFVLAATAELDAARLMGPETRNKLLELRDSGVQVRTSDEGMWAWIGFNRSNCHHVPESLDRMVEVATRIVANHKRFCS